MPGPRLCYATHQRVTSAHCKRGGLPPSLAPLVHDDSRQSVGAGHARPSTLPLPPRILCIVGRQATGPLHNRPAPSNKKITCPRSLAGRLFFSSFSSKKRNKSPSRKNYFRSIATTTPDSASSASRFGTAIRPLKRSASDQTKSTLSMAPVTMKAQTMTR